MALTDLEVKRAKAADKPYKLSDGGGMFLLVQPNGAKYWRLAYRFEGKQKTLAIGVYPAVSLADARARRDDARKLLANNADPGAVKQAQKSARAERASNSFEVIAREWFAKYSAQWAENHAGRIIARLERDILPFGNPC